MNTWAVPVIKYTAGIIDWTKAELEDMDRRTRKHSGHYIPKVMSIVCTCHGVVLAETFSRYKKLWMKKPGTLQNMSGKARNLFCKKCMTNSCLVDSSPKVTKTQAQL